MSTPPPAVTYPDPPLALAAIGTALLVIAGFALLGAVLDRLDRWRTRKRDRAAAEAVHFARWEAEIEAGTTAGEP